MSETARIREVRQELEELRDPGPHDGPGHALFLALQKSYLEDLELLGAPIQPEEVRRPVLRLAPRKPIPATKPPIPATKPPVSETKPVVIDPPPTQEVRHADSPGHAGAPGAPSVSEIPMSKLIHAASAASPEEQLDTLLAKLSNATGACATALDKGSFLKARSLAYVYRHEISKLVKTHRLEAPTLPRTPTNPFKKGGPGAKAKSKTPPPSTWKRLDMDAVMRPESEAQAIDTPIGDLGKLPPPPFEGYTWFRDMDRRLLDNLSHFRNSERKPEEWRQIARDLAILETTAGAARQIAERHAEVA